MSETLQLLKAFIDAAGYEAKRDILNGWEVQKKPKKPRQAKESAYTEDFEQLWASYPKGNKGSKSEAFRQYEARKKEAVHNEIGSHGESHVMLGGCLEYKKFIDATGQYMMHVSRFLGRDKHYLNDYTIPEQVKKQQKPEWAKLPTDKNQYDSHARKHGLPTARPGEGLFEYEQRLRAEINKRLGE